MGSNFLHSLNAFSGNDGTSAGNPYAAYGSDGRGDYNRTIETGKVKVVGGGKGDDKGVTKIWDFVDMIEEKVRDEAFA